MEARSILRTCLRLLRLDTRIRALQTIVALLLLLNVKVLPGIWHLRLVHAVYGHLVRKRGVISKQDGPRAIFEPVIIRTRSPMAECDYNIHKSNSTYFADLDVARSHLVASLLKRGINAYNEAAAAGKSTGRLLIALGAVSCSFKREIPPYTPYEIWSRIICWDQKWIYIVSYFVKKGAVRPKHYTIRDERGFFGLGWFGDKDKGYASTPEEVGKAIYATAISKYVFKSGRKTIPPAQVFESCGLAPEKPLGSNLGDSLVDVQAELATEPTESILEPELSDGVWSWDRVEQERQRGLEYAKACAALDNLADTFVSERVQGRYWSFY